MFKNRAFQVKLVKTTDEDQALPRPDVSTIDAQEINEIAQDQVVNAAIAVGGAVVAVKVVSMFTEIIVHTAKTYIK